MNKLEKNILHTITQNQHIAFLIIMSILGLMIRLSGRDFLSADMYSCLIPWFEEIKANGNVRALSSQVGNYNLLYQTLISFMTYLNGNCVYYYKALSILFDYLLAFYSASFICEIKKTHKNGFLFGVIYAIVLFLPTVVLNSAFWGQCDSIYTFFIIATLFYLYKKHYLKAFIYLGVAFAFKFQAIFILPFIISYYFYKKDFSISNFFISLFTFWITGCFAYIQGRNIFTPFTLYQNQADTYHNMYLNIHSFWLIFGNDYDAFHTFAILLTLVICGLGLYVLLSGYKSIDCGESYLNTACWFVWTCILFLPAMHERYTYLLDILLVLLCFIDKKYIKYAALSFLLSFITYGAYLIGNDGIRSLYALIFIVSWVHYTYVILLTPTPKST